MDTEAGMNKDGGKEDKSGGHQIDCYIEPQMDCIHLIDGKGHNEEKNLFSDLKMSMHHDRNDGIVRIEKKWRSFYHELKKRN